MIIKIKILAKKIYGLFIIGQSKQFLKLASLDELVRIKSDLSLKMPENQTLLIKSINSILKVCDDEAKRSFELHRTKAKDPFLY